jgi:hypothetical protein
VTFAPEIMAGCMTRPKGENLVSAVLRCPGVVCRLLEGLSNCKLAVDSVFLVHCYVIGPELSRLGPAMGLVGPHFVAFWARVEQGQFNVSAAMYSFST